MKRFTVHISILVIAISFIGISSCKKESFITSPDALLRTSVDTLHYDTVFTTAGSITQSLKIFNSNDQKLRLSSVQLMGGASSFFKINVDGVAGTSFSDIEINANDSIYVFATVNINQSTANLPFIVQDSIRINYNGNTKFVQLDALGQNANFLRNKRVTTDSTWNNNLPFVILGSITVDSAKTLTISKGCKVYFHADAPMIVNGTLKAIGDKNDIDRIKFNGDRLDEPYKNFPGSWPGIYFNTNSKNNVMQYCIIKNAYQGTIVQNQASLSSNPKLTLQETILDNIYDVAVGGSNTTIDARNCLISNCGYNVYLTAGGTYNFNHCTLASYGNNYLPHKYPALTISDVAGSALFPPVNFSMKNSIIYGEGGLAENEISINKKGTQFVAAFDNVLYKMKDADPAAATFTGTKLKYTSAVSLFDSIDIGNRLFNFKLSPTSPCIDKGTNTGLLFDLDGNNRNVGLPDLGCYEKQ